MSSIFPRCRCCVNCSHQSFIISRANRAVGVKRMTIKRMRVSCAHPPCCESSPIANSHHENSNLGLTWNCTHIGNAEMFVGIGKACSERGFSSRVRLKLSVTDSRATKSAGMPRTPNAGATAEAPNLAKRLECAAFPRFRLRRPTLNRTLDSQIAMDTIPRFPLRASQPRFH